MCSMCAPFVLRSCSACAPSPLEEGVNRDARVLQSIGAVGFYPKKCPLLREGRRRVSVAFYGVIYEPMLHDHTPRREREKESRLDEIVQVLSGEAEGLGDPDRCADDPDR